MDLKIRKETPADHLHVHEVTRQALGRAHAELADHLRDSPYFIPNLSLVAEVEGQVIGHMMFTLAIIRNDQGPDSESLVLALLAIRPDWQHQGCGSHLMNMGLAVARELGYRCVIGTGNNRYCARFGFGEAENLRLPPSGSSPPVRLMALELVPESLRQLSGSVIFPPGISPGF
ncbi:MAG TPA: N-acetyltransferase [Sphingobacteriaceae bacterium]